MSALNRVLYRSLLRISGNGSRPECFLYESFLASRGGTATQKELPRTAREAVRLLRAHFEDCPPGGRSDEALEPFSVLRGSSTLARALHPPTEALRAELPVFVYPHHTLLPGERSQLIFFEPRYTQMMDQIADAKNGAQNMFVHLPRPPNLSAAAAESPGASTDGPGGDAEDGNRSGAEGTSGGEGGGAAEDGEVPDSFTLPTVDVGTVVSVLSSHKQPDGCYSVEVIAGPRCRITKQRFEDITKNGTEYNPLLHVEYELLEDKVPGSEYEREACKKKAQRAIDLLTTVPNSHDVLRNAQALPPLMSPERLSFYLAYLCFAPVDVRRRMYWLACQSTQSRLDYVIRMFEERINRINESPPIPVY